MPQRIFLAYNKFDGTFHNDGHKDDLVKTWEAHRNDWKEGDPTWKNGKGKEIIGAHKLFGVKGNERLFVLDYEHRRG